MNPIIMAAAVLMPVVFGILIALIPFKSRRQMYIYTETVVILTSLVVFGLLLRTPQESFTLFRFTGDLSVSFRLDGLGKVFAGLVSFLWPFATLYAFEYMEHEERHNVFFMFYTVTYGITLGISMSENLLAMYFFYEMLTLVTLPLIMHTLSREAILASRTYLVYSLGGAAFAFAGLIFIGTFGSTLRFVPGGVLDPAKIAGKENLMLLLYVLAFCGFSVKAAMMPFSSWLPQAGVAPTPVTALLHAVAVVKAGAFACMRLTYYCFGIEWLRGTWAQNLLLVLVIFTIVYGCSRALKETHFKRRLAWSTVSNLSYILFGVLLMSHLGLEAALTHMISHAFMKITAFFCAGAVICKTEREYIWQLDGFGRKMPWVFIVYTISSLALMGVPGMCGFIGKMRLAEAAVDSCTVMGYIGVAALLISALLTAMYMMAVSVRAFFPGKRFDYSVLSDVQDPGWKILLPLTVFCVIMVVLGLHSAPLAEFFAGVAAAV